MLELKNDRNTSLDHCNLYGADYHTNAKGDSMNERIQQLALQAGLKMCGCGCEMPTRQSAKFAELIVQECCSQVREIDAMEIRKHFGVEE